MINYAYYLAKHGVRYSDGSANNLTHKTFEAIQYYLLKASNELAKEQGACPWFNETTYAQGVLPIDTYKKELDKLTNEPLHYDWEALRQDIKQHGLRNSTLSALMPSETSSQMASYVRSSLITKILKVLMNCYGKCLQIAVIYNSLVSCRNLSTSRYLQTQTMTQLVSRAVKYQ